MEKDLTVKSLLETLDGIAAFGLAEQWDNVGLMVGDPGQSVRGILVALDPTEELLAEAKECGANCIITHHPLIFNPLKSINTAQPLGRFLRQAMENEVTVIGCHTNLDQAAGGVNDALAVNLGMVETTPLVPASDGTAGPDTGLGRIGQLAENMERDAFINHLCTLFNLPVLRVAGEIPETISTLAVCGGSGSELAEAALARGAQVYITGEVKHSTARWAEASGFCVVDAGHYVTENLVVTSLVKQLGAILSEKGMNIPVRGSVNQQNPFTYHVPVK